MSKPAHIPTDSDLAAYEARAAQLAKAFAVAEPSQTEAARRWLPHLGAELSLDQAKIVLAKEHGHDDWNTFAAHLEQLTNRERQHPLRDAITHVRSVDPAALRDLLAEHPEVLTQRGTHGHSLLDLACRAVTGELAIPTRATTAQHHALIDLLLEAGADPDAAADHGWTPLHTAGMSGNSRLAEQLIAAGASPAARVWQQVGATPLSYALFYAQRDAASVIASQTVEPDNLRSAAALGRVDRLRELLTTAGELPAEATRGRDFYRPILLFPKWTPTIDRQETLDEALTWAARNGQVTAMQELVAHGADISSNPYRGTPLLCAIYSDQLEAAAWLLARGVDANQQHDFGGSEHGRGATALHLAAQYGNLRCVRLLLEHGALTTIEDQLYQATAIGWADFGEQREAAALLRASLDKSGP